MYPTTSNTLPMIVLITQQYVYVLFRHVSTELVLSACVQMNLSDGYIFRDNIPVQELLHHQQSTLDLNHTPAIPIQSLQSFKHGNYRILNSIRTYPTVCVKEPAYYGIYWCVVCEVCYLHSIEVSSKCSSIEWCSSKLPFDIRICTKVHQ